jgi:hypothetical protein
VEAGNKCDDEQKESRSLKGGGVVEEEHEGYW